MADQKLHLAHILVTREYEAQDLERKLAEGKGFGELAEKFSTCPSAKMQGDLGTIALSRLDQDFADAAELLAPQEISKIVKTRFGYHLIKRLE